MAFNTIDEIINALEQNNFYGLYAIEDRDPTTSDACTRENGIWLNKKTGEFFIFVEYDPVKGYIWQSLATGIQQIRPSVNLSNYRAVLEIPVSINFYNVENKNLLFVKITENQIKIQTTKPEEIVFDNVNLSLFWDALLDSVLLQDIHFTNENDEPIYFIVLNYSKVNKIIDCILLLENSLNKLKVFTSGTSISPYNIKSFSFYKFVNYFNIINESDNVNNYILKDLLLSNNFLLSLKLRSYSDKLYKRNYKLEFFNKDNTKLFEMLPNATTSENYFKINIFSNSFTFKNNSSNLSVYKFLCLNLNNDINKVFFFDNQKNCILEFLLDEKYFLPNNANITLDSQMLSQTSTININVDTTTSIDNTSLELKYDTTITDSTANIVIESFNDLTKDSIIPDNYQEYCICELDYTNFPVRDKKGNFIFDLYDSNSDFSMKSDNYFYFIRYNTINLIKLATTNYIKLPVTLLMFTNQEHDDEFFSCQKQEDFLMDDEINIKGSIHYSDFNIKFTIWNNHINLGKKVYKYSESVFTWIALSLKSDTTNNTLSTSLIAIDNNLSFVLKQDWTDSVSVTPTKLASPIFSFCGLIKVDNNNNIIFSSKRDDFYSAPIVYMVFTKFFNLQELENLVIEIRNLYLEKHKKLKELFEKF